MLRFFFSDNCRTFCSVCLAQDFILHDGDDLYRLGAPGPATAEFLSLSVQCLLREPRKGSRLILDGQLTCLLLADASRFPSSASIYSSQLVR